MNITFLVGVLLLGGFVWLGELETKGNSDIFLLLLSIRIVVLILGVGLVAFALTSI